MAKNLEMVFENSAGKNARISVADPKDGLTPAEIQTAMDTIVAKNIFNTAGGDIVKAVSARMVTRDVVDILPES